MIAGPPAVDVSHRPPLIRCRMQSERAKEVAMSFDGARRLLWMECSLIELLKPSKVSVAYNVAGPYRRKYVGKCIRIWNFLCDSILGAVFTTNCMKLLIADSTRLTSTSTSVSRW